MTIVNWELNHTKPRKTLADRINKRLGIEIYPMNVSNLLGEEVIKI